MSVPGVDPFAWAAKMGAILESLGIRYVVGGSVAAMLYGEIRSTTDLDVVIDVDERKVLELVQRLKPDFYVEEEDALQAVRHGSSFNAIDFSALMKIDFFIAEKRAEVREQLKRGRVVTLPGGKASFYAPEDILIRKLLWFRMSGEQSDRQWRDVVAILRVSPSSLDDDYLARAAESFGVTDLLDRARLDAAP